MPISVRSWMRPYYFELVDKLGELLTDVKFVELPPGWYNNEWHCSRSKEIRLRTLELKIYPVSI